MAFTAYEAQSHTRRQRNAAFGDLFGKPCAGKPHARFEREPYRNFHQEKRKVGFTNATFDSRFRATSSSALPNNSLGN